MMERVNANASVFCGKNGVFPVDKILNTGTTKPDFVEEIKHTHHHHHEVGDGESNSHKITTFTITFPGPLDLNHLQLDLNRIVHLYRHQVYRVKGFIAIPNYPNRVILQSARSAFIATDGSPWETQDERLVFIGRDLKKAVFEKMFNRHLVKENAQI